MNSTELRKLSLKCFIGFLVLTGLLAVVMVVVGRFGELELKILLSTLTVSAANVCALSCAAAMERHDYRLTGLLGIGFAVVAGLLSLLGIWVEISVKVFWQSTVSAIICAGIMAHMFLLLLPALKQQHRWFQTLSCTVLIVLVAMLHLLVWGELEAEGFFRALAAVAIVAVIQTLVTPLLARLAKPEKPAQQQTITLTADPQLDDVYCSDDGRRYRLQEVVEQ
ncbi:MAG: hypothetical protein OIF34_00910 [Porticoccaceae bacterium]|nr:hypothetical protein [Porticoccaceae bacterium]